MPSVPPLYDRISRIINHVNGELEQHEQYYDAIRRQMPGAMASDIDFFDILDGQCHNLEIRMKRLAKRKKTLEEWYFHTFPLYDLISPTTGGASSR